MRKIIFAVFIIIVIAAYQKNLFAQITGVSANKLTLLSASILPEGTFEFEPAFSVINSNHIFNDKWKSAIQDGHSTASSLDFRMTAGLTEHLEIGASISSNIEEINFGAKYLIISGDEINLALSGGSSLPAGNKYVADTSIQNENFYTASFGPVLSYNINESNSVDVAFVYTTSLGKSSFTDQIYAGFGWGYNLREDLQLVMEIAGFACIDNEICSSKLSLYPGVTYDITQNFSFAFGFQHDLIGKNEEDGFGYFGAFTITFD